MITFANSARSLTPALPRADRPQDHVSSLINDKAAHKASQVPLSPHLSVFAAQPAHANTINVQALAQDSAAQSKAQESEETVRDDVQRLEDIDIVPARDSDEPQIIAGNEDMGLAEILVELAKEQRPISSTTDAEDFPVAPSSEPKANINMELSRKFPDSTCPYHHVVFPVKAEKDKHTMTHFKGALICGYKICDFLTDFRNVENIEQWLNLIQTLRFHIRDSHLLDEDGFKCYLCFRDLNKTGYLEHLDDCILRTVELQNSAKAEEDPTWFHNNYRKDSPEASCPSLSSTAFDPFHGYSECFSTGRISPPPDIFSAAYDPLMSRIETPRFILQSTSSTKKKHCRICGKLFKRSYDWKVHMMVHTIQSAICSPLHGHG
ncbi:hypothetical protein IMSHALPRED_011151 [Imshaugia aleurites]|uniref:C2H2-type domain-containing protein n=1 Tax=Imshaugia aleurites TaxID=172621 RepID=A0A8H3G7B0_9LECA|nr:hypothetical protein IMSHALPRED_011151 [Imshaugia aleurites]